MSEQLSEGERERPFIDVSGWTPEQMIYEYERAEALVEAEGLAQGLQLPSSEMTENKMLALGIYNGVRAEAERNPVVCHRLFDLLRTDPDGDRRLRATDLVLPMLAHDVADDGPGPEATISAWINLLSDPEDGSVSNEARTYIGVLLHPSSEAISSRLTVHQMSEIFRYYWRS